ncbi:MAG: diguanylate cyclase [Leptolyngbya sp.]|nr:diguanylate cyclase [Leptolyngbya sp.]
MEQRQSLDNQRSHGGTAGLEGPVDALIPHLQRHLQTPLWLYAIGSLDLLWANPAALAWMGMADVAQAQTWLQSMGQTWRAWLQRCWRALAEGQAWEEMCPTTAQGQARALYGVASIVPLAQDQTGLLLEGHYLLGHTASEQQTILSNIPDLLIRMTREGQCLYLRHGQDITLWGELRSNQTASVYDLMPQALADLRLQHTQQALDTGTPQVYRQEIEVRGQVFHEEVRVVPLGEAEVLIIVRNITPVVVAEQKLVEQADRFRQQAQRDRILAEVTQRIAQSLNLQEILDTAVTELRVMMQTDRVMVYQFIGSEGQGQVSAESVSDPSYSLQEVTVEDRCFVANSVAVQTYRQGRIHRISDVQTANLSPCYRALLTGLRVQANLVLPIVQGEHLWGLVACQQCDAPRPWTDVEVDTLSQLANQLAIAIQQSELYAQLQRANEELHHLATHDKLTGLANRRYFDDYLAQEWRRLTRECAPLSLILIDIDHFKPYNDTYGHLAGDACIEQVAAALDRAIRRPADLAARYGGEEFAVILPHTDLGGAVHAADLIRQEVNQARLPHGSIPNQPYITVSLGIASIQPTLTQSPRVLVDQADQALYQAKQQGRNRYVIANGADPTPLACEINPLAVAVAPPTEEG